MINKTLAQMNAERAIRRTQPGFCLTYGHDLKLKKKSKKPQATSSKPQASSALKKTQLNSTIKK